MIYRKPTFFKLGDVASLTKGSGSKNIEESTEVGICPGNVAYWKKVTNTYKN